MPKTKPIFNIPDRKFGSDDKEMFAVRLPKPLVVELKRIVERKGYDNLTELVITALDQWAQHEANQRKRS